MGKEEYKGMKFKCVENFWDGTTYFEEDVDYILPEDYKLPKPTIRKDAKGRIIKSRPKLKPLDAKAKKAMEALKEETEEAAGKLEAEQPEEKPIDKVNRLIKDNGLDEKEIKELYKSAKAKRAEDKLKVLEEYLEN